VDSSAIVPGKKEVTIIWKLGL